MSEEEQDEELIPGLNNARKKVALVEYLAAHIAMCLMHKNSHRNEDIYEGWLSPREGEITHIKIAGVRQYFCQKIADQPNEATSIRVTEINDDIPF